MDHKKISKKKFAIIGTSSAGKTTLVYEIVAKLKRLGIFVDGVLQQDRRLTFDRAKLETEKEAQYFVIFNQLIKECEMTLKDGTDVLVSDRSVLDFYAYYQAMYGIDKVLLELLAQWASTYDAIYYLEPLKYEDDGARPSDNFRMLVDNHLIGILNYLNLPNVHRIPRENVYQDILSKIDRVLTEDELKLIPVICEQEVLIGGSYAFNRQNKRSDIDVYIKQPTVYSETKVKTMLKDTFGANFDVKIVKPQVWDYLLSQGFKHYA